MVKGAFHFPALFLGLGLLAGLPSIAAAEESGPGFNGRTGFSFAQARGNTVNQAISGEAEVEYKTDGRWIYDGKVGFLRARKKIFAPRSATSSVLRPTITGRRKTISTAVSNGARTISAACGKRRCPASVTAAC